jgi:hypothetical protein
MPHDEALEVPDFEAVVTARPRFRQKLVGFFDGLPIGYVGQHSNIDDVTIHQKETPHGVGPFSPLLSGDRENYFTSREDFKEENLLLQIYSRESHAARQIRALVSATRSVASDQRLGISSRGGRTFILPRR